MRKTACFFQPKGFTLIEIIITVAILAILLGLSTPYLFGTREKALLELERDKIVTSLKDAQQKAIEAYQGYEYGLRFNQVDKQYTLVSVNPRTDPPAIQPVGKRTTLPSQIEFFSISVDPVTDPPTITFSRLTGKPNSSLNLTLISRRFKVEINASEAGMITSTNPEKI